MNNTAIDYNVYPLFPRAFYTSSIQDVMTESDIEFVRNLEMKPNLINLISKNQYIFQEPQLKKLNDAVHEHINIFLKEVLGVARCEAYVTQSWSLINLPGKGMHAHAHSNSVISGSYYYDELPDPPSAMVFYRHIGNQTPIKFSLDQTKLNPFNVEETSFTMKKNDLWLFPSDLSHHVETNMSDKPRYSIAFNCFVKGQLGDYDVSNLLIL